MQIISQNLFITSHSSSHTSFYFTKTHKFPNKLSLNPFIRNPFQFHLTKPNFLNVSHKHQRFSPVNSLFDPDYTVQNQREDANVINIDAFLSVLEFVCLACSAIISIGHVVNYALLGIGKPIFGWLGDKVMTWQWAVLVSGVIVGVLIRRRQWRRICTVNFSRSGSLEQVNLVERIEKIEEDLRSSATIIRVLSRQLEKLGIRFRVTRKALKEPIAKTAELAQKNSEATRALAIQEDNLEKELSEIQKVLLAMQDQQQKQIELILAIAKSSKLLENKREPINRQSSINATNSTMGLKPNHTEALARNKEANDEKI